MAIANTHYGFCGVAAGLKFTYTGNYQTRADGVTELLSSGDITFLEDGVIDVFMVGGGGAGNRMWGTAINGGGGGGGGGGYTRTIRRVSVTAGMPYMVNIGAGAYRPSTNSLVDAGPSQFGDFTVKGGVSRADSSSATSSRGGSAGGSGGGGGVTSNSDYGSGGSDGENGETGYPTSVTAGSGQGFTTREFGEASGKLYAGGGGGGRYMVSAAPVISSGGSGGGGSGAWVNNSGEYQNAAAGVANTGGGGGGGAHPSYSGAAINEGEYGSGGSGIVCFREAAELPELSGTWLLNERLYAPEAAFTELLTFTAGTTNLTQHEFTIFNYDGTYLRFGTTSYTGIYTFSTNKWNNHYTTVIFPEGASASDEFRAWLASNATKQS